MEPLYYYLDYIIIFEIREFSGIKDGGERLVFKMIIKILLR